MYLKFIQKLIYVDFFRKCLNTKCRFIRSKQIKRMLKETRLGCTENTIQHVWLHGCIDVECFVGRMLTAWKSYFPKWNLIISYRNIILNTLTWTYFQVCSARKTKYPHGLVSSQNRFQTGFFKTTRWCILQSLRTFRSIRGFIKGNLCCVFEKIHKNDQYNFIKSVTDFENILSIKFDTAQNIVLETGIKTEIRIAPVTGWNLLLKCQFRSRNAMKFQTDL